MRGHTSKLWRSMSLCVVVGFVWLGGCFAPVKKIAERTALEQQVVAAAVFRAVEAIPIEDAGLEGTYRVEVNSPDGVDGHLVKSILYKRLFEAGIGITENESHRVPRLLAHVVYAGSDLEYSLIGFPLYIPGIPIVFGTLSVYSAETQRGRARIRISIWDEEQTLLSQVPRSVDGTSYFKNETFLMFIGPFLGTDMADFLTPGEERELEEEEQEEEATDGAEGDPQVDGEGSVPEASLDDEP